jgi:TonB-linked SusC/RagA family outer membrane protein
MTGKPSLKCLMAFLLLLINCTYLSAQERVVTGKVKDPQGNPLPGVNVNVWGTRISVTADVSGSFRIPVNSENSVLVFSFVGFLQKEVKVGGDSTFNVAMAYDNADLDQVVVVGYGTSKRRDLTGAVYSVKPGMVTAAPVTNAAEALEGRIPGLDITRNSGAPGGGVNIQLRGTRTLVGTANGYGGTNLNSSPLVIIDGFQGGSLSDLNPNDIESVEVLKDASSTAIYGWMGANGVIIVTTKRGKDRPKVSYSGFYGVTDLPEYPKVRMGDDFINFRKEAYAAANGNNYPATPTILDPNELYYYNQDKWVDWYKLVTQHGISQSHTASIQSGGDKTKVFFSTGIYTETGVVPKTDNTRYNARLNYDQRISNMFKAGFMTQLTYQNTDSRTDPMSYINNMTPFGDPYDSLGNIRLWPGLAPANYTDPKNRNLISPISDMRPNAYKWNTARGNIIANAYVEATPITGLSIRSNFGTTLTYTRTGQYFDSVTLNNYNRGNGSSAIIQNDFSRFYNWDNIVTYTRRIADHSITVTGLTSFTRLDDDNSYAGGTNLSGTSYQFYSLAASGASGRDIRSGYQKATTFSYAGRLNYSYKGKYLLMGTIRADGVSRLSENKKWDYFPSAGIGWNIHQEDFMSNLTFVNNLKVRATWGIAGNASLAPYGTQSVLAAPVNAIIGSGPVATTAPNPIASNANLGWEKTTTVNVGLDYAFLRSRIFGTVDLYQAKTNKILYLRTLPYSTGLSKQWQNLGTSENKGLEVALSTVNVTNRDFRWVTTITFTAAREKLTSLTGGGNIIDPNNPETNSLLLGHPIKSFYGYHKIGIWQTNDKDGTVTNGGYTYQPGDIKVQDMNGDGIIDATNDRGYLGSDVPKWYGGFQNTFSYKGFELSAYFIARYGNTIYADWIAARYNIDGTGNGLAVNYWTPTNPTNDFPRPKQGAKFSQTQYTGYLSMNMVDGSYLKLKTLTLAYTLPVNISRKVYSDKIRLYATGYNVWTKAKSPFLKNYDPERDGSENTPLTRQFVFGANIDF